MPYTSNPFFTPDLRIYVTKDEMSETVNNYVSKSELPDFTKYAKTNELPDFTKYVKTSELPDLSLYAKTSELPNVERMLKKAFTHKDCKYLLHNYDRRQGAERYRRCMSYMSDSQFSAHSDKYCIIHDDCDVEQQCFEHAKNVFLLDEEHRCSFRDDRSCTCRPT